MSYEDIRIDAYAHAASLDGAINPGDKVYRNVATKRLIKTRVTRKPPPPGAANFGVFYFAVSGAHCGDDGKAKPRADGGDGFQIAPAHALTIASDTPVDLDKALETARLKVCCDTERAIEHEERFAALASGG